MSESIERHEQEAILRDLLGDTQDRCEDCANYEDTNERAERIMIEMQRMKVKIVRCGDE
ncbi:hypothetical protein J2D73_19635 [Acetobacter sacchari]|uniref:Uncharacterized protein n=1 Tax=Acetobacter sacchari TaxID=2661687 RepID=A0ABS3M1C8_9PROT|nr:hypothetical protein [Acetobacter sacchari]MBO1361997.1 hypothetical protein [Acetobacter sacchari]